MEYPSTWKATRVAIPVAAIIGTISPKPLWMSSSTRARPDSGACIDAPIMAAALTMANAPDGEPGQASFQAMPAAPPRTAPVASVGVNRPPDAPLPRHMAVTSGLSANRVSSRPPLLCRQAAPAGQGAPGRAAQQLGRGLPADRGAHPDDGLGDHRGAQAAAERQPPVAVPHRLVELGRLAPGVPPQQEPGDTAEHSGDQQGGDPPRRGCLLHAVLQAARVVAERRVLHVEQDRHHQRAEQPGSDAGQRHHHPEPGREDSGAAAGDVRLLDGAAAGGHALLQQRLRRRRRSLALAGCRVRGRLRLRRCDGPGRRAPLSGLVIRVAPDSPGSQPSGAGANGRRITARPGSRSSITTGPSALG